MSTSLEQINRALSEVSDEISRVEQALASAKQRKAQLEQDRVAAVQKEEEERRQAAAAKLRQQQQAKSPAGTAAAAGNEQAYVDRIAELKRQIAEAEAAQQAAVVNASAAPPPAAAAPAQAEETEEEYEEVTEYEEVEYYEEEVIEDEEEEVAPAPAPVAPAAPAVVQNPSAMDYSDVRQQQLDALKEKDKWSKSGWGGGGSKNSSQSAGEVQTYDKTTQSVPHSHLNDQMHSLKQKHAWSKPAWASQAPDNGVVHNGGGVDTNPIANPLLQKNNHSGYTRQVAPKDHLARSAGTFVAPRKDVPPPRLCWIVIDINRRKAGKIVMHLHGQGVDSVVDNFTELKGLNIEPGKKNQPMFIEDIQPKFYITLNQTTKGLDSKVEIYGLVQEGKEVVGAIKKADEHASITIRQAHIYPVKKARASA